MAKMPVELFRNWVEENLEIYKVPPISTNIISEILRVYSLTCGV